MDNIITKLAKRMRPFIGAAVSGCNWLFCHSSLLPVSAQLGANRVRLTRLEDNITQPHSWATPHAGTYM